MSINGARPLSPQQSLQNQEAIDSMQAKKGKSSSAASAASDEVQVSLSGTQAQLMQPGTQDIDLEKVARLKQAIQAGELQIDVGKIADKLIGLSSDLSEE